MFVPMLKKLLGLTALQNVYDRAVAAMRGRTIFESLAEEFELKIEVSDADRNRVPDSGPVLVVANHPMGGLDGIALGAFLTSIRKDWKILSHVWFDKYPELTRNMILVNRNRNKVAYNGPPHTIKTAVSWIAQGNLLAVYPAGTVSRFQWSHFKVLDPPWRSGVARLARLTRPAILPIYIEGRNSWFFQVVSAIHPKLTLFLLGRELLNKRRTAIRIRVGKPIPFDRIAAKDDEAISASLRQITYQLAC